MADESTFYVSRAQDRVVYEAFKKLAATFDIRSGTIVAIPSLRVTVNFSDLPDGVLGEIIELNSHAITRATIEIHGLSVSFFRGGASGQNSPALDEFKLVWNPNAPNALIDLDRFRIVKELQQQFFAIPSVELTRSADEETEFIHREVLNRLQIATVAVIEKGVENSARMDANYAERAAALDQSATRQRTLLEEEFSLKTKALESRELAFEARLKEIDNRNNTHARRQIRDGLLEEVQDRIGRFDLSRQTVAKRRRVALSFYFALLVMVAFVGFQVWALVEYRSDQIKVADAIAIYQGRLTAGSEGLKNAVQDQLTWFQMLHPLNEQYWLWGRLAFGGVGLVLMLLYYLRWENAWAQRHADAEFQLEQFRLDVSRANWVIESCLEWKKETNSHVPSELMASITKNLFVDRAQSAEQVIHPADELASALLGSASQLKVNANGAELEIKNPGKKLSEPKVVKPKD